jgi:NitT/TauT family transport system substrate-binding protein
MSLAVSWRLVVLALCVVASGCGPGATQAPGAPTAAPAPTSAPAPVTVQAPTAPPAATVVPTQTAAPTIAATPAALTPLTVSYGEIVPQELPLWVTKEAGLFEQHGLIVNPQLIVSAQEIAALLAGETQIANPGAPNMLNAEATGADLVVTAVPMALSPFSIYAAADIASMADLKGKNVGISQFGSPSELEMRVALLQSGMDPDRDVTWVPAGSTQNRTAALIQGAIQGAAANPLEGAQLKRRGLHVIYDLAASKEPWAETTVATRRIWLDQHRDLMQAYIDAIVAGMQRLRQDKPFAVSVMMKYFKSDDEQAMSEAYDAYLELFPTLPEPRVEQFETARSILSRTNAAVGSIDLGKLLDPSFVQRAASRAPG